MHAHLCALALVAVCTACERATIDQPSEPPKPVVEYRDSVVLERPHDCKDLGDNCSQVDIRLPVFFGDSGMVARTLNRAVRDFFVDAIGGTSQPTANPADSTVPMPSIVDAAQLLFADAREVTEKFPEAAMPWTVHGTCKVLTVDSLVCVELYVDSFTGGAHGNTTTSFVVVNVRTGTRILVKDLIKNVKMFTDSAEHVFRRQIGLDSITDLSDRGYFIENNTFSLPENIGVTPDSVVLYYNTYEIAPYVMGPTRITLPRTALQAH